MAFFVEDPEADLLAQQLARVSGQPVRIAVVQALREELRRQSGRRDRSGLQERLRAIAAECAALPDVDTRSPEEIVAYDEIGLPV